MTSFWQMDPLVEFQYVITGSPSAAESLSITGCVRSIRNDLKTQLGSLHLIEGSAVEGVSRKAKTDVLIVHTID